MKTARKVLLLVLCAALLVSASVLGTIAYLTDIDVANNTFTVGDVQINLDEAQVDLYGDPVEGADRVKENEYKLLPGHTYTKDPTVTVLEGSEESYIRLIVTVNEKADLDAIGVNILNVFTGYDSAKWNLAAQTKDDTADTRTYEFRYYTTVDAREAEQKLEALFTKMVIPGDVTNEQLATIKGMKIDIVAQAIQADGFADADAAWEAFAK